jgi:hypothetical protein
MAGGIDWFRWHHGSVTDPKFQLIARKAGASLPDVLAVWAYVLEQASAAEERGNLGELDAEAIDCMFGFPSTETRTADILKAMTSRGLLCGDSVCAWDKRQPKREREEDRTATERKRRQRAREGQTDSEAETTTGECHAMSRHVTPETANESHVTPRGEERREEQIQEEPTALVDGTAYRPPPTPTAEIVELYHRHLPALPAVEVLNDARKRAVAARWREVCAADRFSKAAALDWFGWFFERVSQSDFLMGRSPGKSGRTWAANFDFLFTPTKFVRVVEGAYHQGANQ